MHCRAGMNLRPFALTAVSALLSTLVACAAPGASDAEGSSDDALTNAPASSCVNINESAAAAPASFEGTLVIDRQHTHPTMGPTNPFILQLAAPRCVIDTNRFFVSEVQLAPSGIDLAPFVGKKVKVTDGEPFAEHTAWHAREVVVMTTTVTLSEVPTACLAFENEVAAATSFEGKLVVDQTFEHPSVGRTRPFILQLATPRCVDGGKAISEIHLSPQDVDLAPLVGRTVQVVDGEPFTAHTAWHARDVVVLAKTIVAKP